MCDPSSRRFCSSPIRRERQIPAPWFRSCRGEPGWCSGALARTTASSAVERWPNSLGRVASCSWWAPTPAWPPRLELTVCTSARAKPQGTVRMGARPSSSFYRHGRGARLAGGDKGAAGWRRCGGRLTRLRQPQRPVQTSFGCARLRRNGAASENPRLSTGRSQREVDSTP